MKHRNEVSPPAWITWLIERLGETRQSEIIVGDLHEMYEERVRAGTKLKADIGYFIDFISLLLHRAIRRKTKSRSSNSATMFINYFRVALRHLLRQRTHNAINILGLSIGLCVSFIIGLYVFQELSYDRFHEKADRIYLLPMTWKFSDTHVSVASSISAGGPFMKENFPEVEAMVRTEETDLTFNHEGQAIKEGEVLAADSTFFQVFSFPLLVGNPSGALTEPLAIILTEKAAVKYFGADWKDKDVTSKSIEGQNKKQYKITGVMADPPANSHIQFSMLLSMISLPKNHIAPNWDNSSFFTYILLTPLASANEVVKKIPERIAASFGPEANKYGELDLLPLTDVYLNNPKYPGFSNVSDIKYVYIFSIIAGLVLVIAVINYMNLSTARSLERAREVGVRKVVGAYRFEIFTQFMAESVLLTFISLLLAFGLMKLTLPFFNILAGKDLIVNLSERPELILYVSGAFLVICLVGGIYPAAILSSYRPAKVLKGKLKDSLSGLTIRKTLVVLQFGISILLIVCTTMINRQLSFMSDKKTGLDKEQIITVPLDSVSRSKIQALKAEFARVPGVESVAATSRVPINMGGQTTIYEGSSPEQRLIHDLFADPDFIKTAGLEILAGRNFTPEASMNGDRWEFVINESALGFFDWKLEEAVGKELTLWRKTGQVVAVVRDFHFAPLHKAIAPLVIHYDGPDPTFYSYFLVRFQGQDFANITSSIEEKWKQVSPSSPFSFSFLDERYNNLYLAESRLSKIMNVFSGLAILIASLGLFGLASYTIVQRTRELGIRKIMGASLANLITLVSGGFIRLVAVSFVLAAPLSWVLMREWLASFEYHIQFNWLLVAIAGLGAVAVVIMTVIYHSVEVATVSPTQSLRSE